MSIRLVNPIFAGSSRSVGFDPDAFAYIENVESVDGQELEDGVRQAISAFVIGSKLDLTWTAIKSSCILAGARTLAGALVPLVGSAPTNIGGLFVAGDYNRRVGLTGNGINKSLRTGLFASSLGNTSHHMFFSGSGFPNAAGVATRNLGGVFNGVNIASLLDVACATSDGLRETRSGTGGNSAGNSATIAAGGITSGTIAGSRTSATELRLYQNGLSSAVATNSNTPSLPAIGFGVFARNNNGTQVEHLAGTIDFFSFGDGLSQSQMLALHNRVTSLKSAIGAAIP